MAKKQLVATDMNSNKITNLANGSSAQDAAAFGQIPVVTGYVAKAGDTMTGLLILKTGSTTVAPLKMVAGTNLTTAVAGTLEFDGTNLYFSV